MLEPQLRILELDPAKIAVLEAGSPDAPLAICLHGFPDTASTWVNLLTQYHYVLRCRLERAQQLLRNTQLSLAAIAYEVGFGNQSHMTSVFCRTLKITPGMYRQQAAH